VWTYPGAEFPVLGGSVCTVDIRFNCDTLQTGLGEEDQGGHEHAPEITFFNEHCHNTSLRAAGLLGRYATET